MNKRIITKQDQVQLEVDDMMNDERIAIRLHDTDFQISKKRFLDRSEIFAFYLDEEKKFRIVHQDSVLGKAVREVMWENIPSPIVQ